MNRPLCFISILYVFAASLPAIAQEQQAGTNVMSPGLRRRALTVDINARVLNNEQEVTWEQIESKTTLSGNPVGLKLVGSNVVVSAQFTPFVRRDGKKVLVAHGQIWIEDPQKGMSYYTSIQTIPIEFNEPVYFFPLGSKNLEDSIEILINVKPYIEPEITPAAKEDGN